MDIHVRVHHWVVVWIAVGLVCGVVALVNILGRHLTQSQEDWVLVIGAMHWLIGGLVCYALDAVKVERPVRTTGSLAKQSASPELEWHYASEFVLPGNRKSLFPPKY